MCLSAGEHPHGKKNAGRIWVKKGSREKNTRNNLLGNCLYIWTCRGRWITSIRMIPKRKTNIRIYLFFIYISNDLSIQRHTHKHKHRRVYTFTPMQMQADGVNGWARKPFTFIICWHKYRIECHCVTSARINTINLHILHGECVVILPDRNIDSGKLPLCRSQTPQWT